MEGREEKRGFFKSESYGEEERRGGRRAKCIFKIASLSHGGVGTKTTRKGNLKRDVILHSVLHLFFFPLE